MPQESMPKQIHTAVEQAKEEVIATRQPWYHLSRIAQFLLVAYAIQLALFGLLAWWVHSNPVIPLDVMITREFQENPTPWLRILMGIISYPGSSFVHPLFILIATIIFWIVGLRLEAVTIVALSAISAGLNTLLKILVGRPRPSTSLVEVFQHATGASFPSGHVMAYLAFWGLLFSFGIILFTGKRWWRILLLIVSTFFVVGVGPSRIYLGDHWASDVLGSYLIGGVLLGITLWIYLRLKERGVMETQRARKRAERSKKVSDSHHDGER